MRRLGCGRAGSDGDGQARGPGQYWDDGHTREEVAIGI